MKEGKARYSGSRVTYIKRNFITEDLSDLEFDYAVSSQTFTISYTEKNENYEIISEAAGRLFAQCKFCLFPVQ